jgi:hypothetical protein
MSSESLAANITTTAEQARLEYTSRLRQGGVRQYIIPAVNVMNINSFGQTLAPYAPSAESVEKL